MDWTRLPRKLLTAWVPVEETRVGGRELTWGEGVEKQLKRASHAFPSADDESTLCAEALPFVPQQQRAAGDEWRQMRLADCYDRTRHEIDKDRVFVLDGMTIADAIGRRVPFDGGDGDGVVSVVQPLTLELLAADVRSGLYGLVSQDCATVDSTALPPGLLVAMGEQGALVVTAGTGTRQRQQLQRQRQRQQQLLQGEQVVYSTRPHFVSEAEGCVCRDVLARVCAVCKVKQCQQPQQQPQWPPRPPLESQMAPIPLLWRRVLPLGE